MLKKTILVILGIAVLPIQGSIPAGVIKLTSATSSIFAGGGQARDVKIDANGKIVACGYINSGGSRYWLVARFTSVGTLDITFNASGTPGYQTMAQANTVANALVIQTDGKIVAVGYYNNTTAVSCRYNADGTIDTSTVNPNPNTNLIGATSSSAVGVTLGTDSGSGITYIVATVLRNQTSTTVPYCVRISTVDLSVISTSGPTTSIGSAVPSTYIGGAGIKPTSQTFIGIESSTQSGIAGRSEAGMVATPYNGSFTSASLPSYTFHTVVAPTDNALYISGRTSTNSGACVYQTDGSLNGLFTTAFLPSAASATIPFNIGGGLALVQTGSVILCASTTLNGSSHQPFISRLTIDNTGATAPALDLTFGTTGAGYTIQTETSLTPGYYAAAAVQSNGYTVVVGSAHQAVSTGEWVLARYKTDGTLDTNFVGLTGVLQDTASPFNAVTNALLYTTTIDSNGYLVVAGESAATSPNAVTIRYTTTAGRDGNFGNNGVTQIAGFPVPSKIRKVVNGGTGYFTAGEAFGSFMILKLTSNGAKDSTFNFVIEDSSTGSAYDILLNGTALAVAGTTNTNIPTIINYNSINGAYNTTIGNQGIQQFTPLGTGTMYGITTVNGTMRYGAGQGTNSNTAFMNFLFNTSGILQDTTAPLNTNVNGFIYTSTIDQSGNIVVGGQTGTNALSIRYTTSAGRDGNTFGNNGVANLTALAATATVQKIINSGTGYLGAGVSSTNLFTTFQLTSAGVLDTSGYGAPNGYVIESTLPNSSAYDILVTGTGLVSVSGVTSSNKLSVINYGPNGIHNAAIGNNGLQIFGYYGTGTMYALNTTTGTLRYGAGQGTLGNIAFVGALANQTGMLQDIASPFNTSTNGFIYTSTIDQSGKIIVGGQYNNNQALTIRYTTSAGRDGNTFGNNGVANLTALAATATVQKIINSGTGYLAAGVSSTNQFTTFKLTSTGGFDGTFNGNGIVAESTVGTSAAYDLLINGTSLTVAGVTQTNKPSVINYNTTTGARTSTIGNNGVQTFNNYGTGTMYALNTTTGTVRYGAGQGNNIAFVKELVDASGILQDTNPPFNTSQQAQIYGGIIDQDGNIVLCGNYNNILTLIVYTSVGERDDNFGIDHNGVAQYSLAGPSNAYSILQSTDGSYYVTGEITVNATTTLAVLKYTNGGLLDTSFGTNGVAQLPATFGQSRGYSIARNTVDGSLLIAGQVTVNAQLVPAFVLYDASGSLVTTFGSQGVQTFSQYGTGSLNASLVSPSLFATGAGGMSTLETNDQIATLVQVGQGSSTAAQINTGF